MSKIDNSRALKDCRITKEKILLSHDRWKIATSRTLNDYYLTNVGWLLPHASVSRLLVMKNEILIHLELWKLQPYERLKITTSRTLKDCRITKDKIWLTHKHLKDCCLTKDEILFITSQTMKDCYLTYDEIFDTIKTNDERLGTWKDCYLTSDWWVHGIILSLESKM